MICVSSRTSRIRGAHRDMKDCQTHIAMFAHWLLASIVAALPAQNEPDHPCAKIRHELFKSRRCLVLELNQCIHILTVGRELLFIMAFGLDRTSVK